MNDLFEFFMLKTWVHVSPRQWDLGCACSPAAAVCCPKSTSPPCPAVPQAGTFQQESICPRLVFFFSRKSCMGSSPVGCCAFAWTHAGVSNIIDI